MIEDTYMKQATVLVATGEADYGEVLVRFLEGDGYVTERCHDSKGVLRVVGRKSFDVVVLDLELDDAADLDLVSYILRQNADTRIILLFDIHKVERAVDGIRRGAFFYLPKSCQPSDVALIVTKAVHALKDLAAMSEYKQAFFEEIAGSTPAMKRVVELIQKVAPTDSTVLLLGESGTGKEVMANTIHRLSPRRDQAFVAINCAALPEQLLESELFGHVKGAFTSAESDKVGLFEEADNGTIFLDEIGDLPLTAQAKLLRVLQNGEIRRVGDAQTRHVDVRILAATNRNLVEAVADKLFREDVYFRLNVIQILIPPLRERRDAIPALVREFLRRYSERFHRNVHTIDENAWSLLQHYRYPGNIRELESTVAHAVILAEGDTIHVENLPDSIRFGDGAKLALPHYDPGQISTLVDMEKELIRTALEKLNGNQTEVAKKLGISRSTLWRKMKEYGLSRSSSSGEVVEPVSP